jgi:hypothetical protein
METMMTAGLVAMGVALAVCGAWLRKVSSRLKELDKEAEAHSAQLAALSGFLRDSKLLQAEVAEFNKRINPDPQLKPEAFVLQGWWSFRDRLRFAHWRGVSGKRSTQEARDDNFGVYLDVEAKSHIRIGALPHLMLLRQKLPFVVTQDHLDWLNQTDSVRGFLEWLIADVEKGSQGQAPAELESLKALLLRK